MKKSGTKTRRKPTKKVRRIPELERFGPYKWVSIQSVEAPHGVRYPHHWERLFKSFRRHKGWHGRPLLVERVSGRHPGIRYVAWTGSHRLAAAFAARIWEVPVIEIRRELWDEVHGKAKTVRLSETFDDEQRLAMISVTRDVRAIALMDREVPRTSARQKARDARAKAKEKEGAPWSPLGKGKLLEARVSEDVVEVRHKGSGEVRGFGRDVLESLLALFPRQKEVA